MPTSPGARPIPLGRAPHRYLVGRWSELEVAPATQPSREYICFDVRSKAKNSIAGQIDAREIFPRVFQIGIKMHEASVSSGLGLDASIALIAWLFDFRDAHGVVVVTATKNRHLDGLFRLGISRQTARSNGYLRSAEGSLEARWGVIQRTDFERENIVLEHLREAYLSPSSGPDTGDPRP